MRTKIALVLLAMLLVGCVKNPVLAPQVRTSSAAPAAVETPAPPSSVEETMMEPVAAPIAPACECGQELYFVTAGNEPCDPSTGELIPQPASGLQVMTNDTCDSNHSLHPKPAKQAGSCKDEDYAAYLARDAMQNQMVVIGSGMTIP